MVLQQQPHQMEIVRSDYDFEAKNDNTRRFFGYSNRNDSINGIIGGGSKKSIHKNNDCDNNSMEGKSRASASLSTTFSSLVAKVPSKAVLAILLLVGMVASGSFLGMGMTSADRVINEQFAVSVSVIVDRIHYIWTRYEKAAMYIHARCQSDSLCTRESFVEIFHYLKFTGIDFSAAAHIPRIEGDDEREEFENASKQYYSEYTDVAYRGFLELAYSNQRAQQVTIALKPRSIQPVYYPLDYFEPVEQTKNIIGFDLYSFGEIRSIIQDTLQTGKPTLTSKFYLLDEIKARDTNSVMFLHPGINVSTQPNQLSSAPSLSALIFQIPTLLQRAANQTAGGLVPNELTVFLYDTTNPLLPTFLGGVAMGSYEEDPVVLPERTIPDIYSDDEFLLIQETVMNFGRRQWTIFVASNDNTFPSNYQFLVLGGVAIFSAFTILAIAIHASTERLQRENKIKSKAEAEKARITLQNAKQCAKTERELNDFIAHEVRNPIAAAMSASSFVRAELYEAEPLSTKESIESVREDVAIIDNSLHFVNDMLRNMLDMHRASTQQLIVTLSPVSILHDVLKPVDSMLYRRGTNIDVLVDCPEHLVVLSDRLRLEQIMLNLGRNSAKFLAQCSRASSRELVMSKDQNPNEKTPNCFIRLRAEVVNNSVHLAVEDSGPGIKAEKRDRLFSKFQESLELLSQHAGVGLVLCKHLAELMGGTVFLDETYDSGVPGYPGTRFVVALNTPPLDPDDFEASHLGAQRGHSGADNETISGSDNSRLLPHCLSVLFVDDDLVLRKLFRRALSLVAPGWKVKEAANGETAIRMCEAETFDLIFMDLYMASVEKKMIGTEVVKAMRDRGITCRICGLSANDSEDRFLEAGADYFFIKPLPCDARELKSILYEVLFKGVDEDLRHIYNLVHI